MSQTTELRDRETVEEELSRAKKSRDKTANALREVRGELEIARQEEGAGIERAAVSGKAPKASQDVGKLETREGELSRQLETLNLLVNRLEHDLGEVRLEELNAEVTRLSAYAEEARERRRAAAEEAIKAGNEAVAVRQQRDDLKRSLSRKTPRSADRASIYIRT